MRFCLFVRSFRNFYSLFCICILFVYLTYLIFCCFFCSFLAENFWFILTHNIQTIIFLQLWRDEKKEKEKKKQNTREQHVAEGYSQSRWQLWLFYQRLWGQDPINVSEWGVVNWVRHWLVFCVRGLVSVFLFLNLKWVIGNNFDSTWTLFDWLVRQQWFWSWKFW